MCRPRRERRVPRPWRSPNEDLAFDGSEVAVRRRRGGRGRRDGLVWCDWRLEDDGGVRMLVTKHLHLK